MGVRKECAVCHMATDRIFLEFCVKNGIHGFKLSSPIYDLINKNFDLHMQHGMDEQKIKNLEQHLYEKVILLEKNKKIILQTPLKEDTDNGISLVKGEYAGNRAAIEVITSVTDIQTTVVQNLWKNLWKLSYHPDIRLFYGCESLAFNKYALTYEELELSLSVHVSRNPYIEMSPEALNIMRGLVSVVEHLHDRGFYHGDLNPENIFVQKGTLKIGDLRSTKKIETPSVNFTQKHEIRQVYVRSTARIYEIYYAPALQSDDEYLCTVRCSATSVEDNFFPETDVKEVISVNLGDPIDILPKTKVANENKVGTQEDDWVEVKRPADRVDDGNAYLPNQRDYYEATAEINDSEPCMSLTLRLLSIKSKGCVYVDEVYVFADPIDTDDSENQTANATNSSNSSLMAMVLPAFLGLNKSRFAQLHDQNNSNPVGLSIEAESGPTTSTNRVNLVDQQDGKVPYQSEAKVPSFTTDKNKVSDSTQNNAFSYNRADSLLELLVSRVSRIEDICLRFEEKMLKPINSIEARLERVEHQIELLSKNSQSPRIESNVGSTSNSGDDSQLCDEPGAESIGSFSNGTHKPPEDTAAAAYTQFHEDVLTDEKEEANDVLELPEEEKPKKTFSADDALAAAVAGSELPKEEKPKKAFSVDDALAAALAGLSSFTKANDISDVPLESSEEEFLKTKQTSIDTTLVTNSSGDASVSCGSLKADALEFTGEDTDGEDNVVSSTPESSLVEKGDLTTTSRDAYTEIPDHIFCSPEASEVVDEAAMSPTTSFSCSSPHKSYKTDPELIKHDSKVVKTSTFDKADILKYFPDQSPDGSCSPNSGEVNDDGFESKVDFESQILEVKFSSLGGGSVDSHLEALLSYTNDPATKTEAFIAPETNEKPTINSLLLDLDTDDVGEGVEQDLPPVEQETSFASLI